MKNILAPLALVAAGIATVAVSAPPPGGAWQIGPVIRGKNYSKGMPGSLQDGPQGPFFEFPQQGRGEVHYVSLPVRSLEGARSVTLRYRVDAATGARFVARENGEQGTIGIAFQRTGDNWSARGRYEAYRWYSPTATPLSPGVHTLRVRLDDPNWVAVMGTKSGVNPGGFADAVANAETVSLTFGSSGARGHGVYATAPARFTLLDFSIS